MTPPSIPTTEQISESNCVVQCIPYTDIRTTLECVVDGAWGSLWGSACLCYLIQRYSFMGTPRVSVYFFSLSTAMNSLTKLGHQVDAEISGFQIGTKETVKALKTLKELNVRLEHGPILISDSQTVLSLCSRPSNTLDLSTSLVVSRVQEVFTTDNLYFAPGLFSVNVSIFSRDTALIYKL